jgi:hypothetical protein
VDLGCHSIVDLSIEADGCPEAGDFCCHSGVDFWTIEADGCLRAGDFVCHLAVDLGCHRGVGFSSVGVDSRLEARDVGFVGGSGVLGRASGVPLHPGWSNDVMQQIKPWLFPFCSFLSDSSENLGSASGIPLHPG